MASFVPVRSAPLLLSNIRPMGDYCPVKLSAKWAGQLQPLLAATREQWEAVRPRLPFLRLRWQQPDIRNDRVTPLRAKRALLFRGQVVWGLISRAYFPAYVPVRRTHYGSVVYALDAYEPDSIFELAWAVNQLRANNDAPPVGTEKIAAAMGDQRAKVGYSQRLAISVRPETPFGG